MQLEIKVSFDTENEKDKELLNKVVVVLEEIERKLED
jgi:hypothetical protein